MADRIAGLDIGSFSLKVAVVEPKRTPQVVAYREIPLHGVGGLAAVPDPDGSVESDGAMPGGDAGPPAADDEPASGADADDWSKDVSPEFGDEAPGPSQIGDGERPWKMALAQMVEEGLFEGVHRVITSFPDGQAVTLHQEVPFEKPREVEEILPHILMDELPLSLDEVVYDFVVVPGKSEGKWEALIGIVERAQMAEFLEQCQWTGLNPAVVGVPELMLRYAGDLAVGAGVDSYGIIDMGHRFTRLLIMDRGKPVIAHSARTAGQAVTQALAENFQLSVAEARNLKHDEGVVAGAARGGDRRVRKVRGTIEEALRPVVRDMRRTFQSAYAKHDVAVDVIYLCGGTSRLRGIEEFLEGEFEVPVQPLDVRTVDWRTAARSAEVPPESVLALGSAAQSLVDESDRKLIDFRQDEFVYRGKASYLRKQLVRLGVVAAVLALMLTGVLVMQYVDRKAQLSAMETALAEETEELFGEPVTSTSEVHERLHGDATVRRDFVPEMSAYEQMVRILDETSPEVPLELDRIEVDTDRNLAQIHGQTDSPQSVDRLAADIDELDCLSDVSKEQVNVRSDDEVQFELQISSNCS